MMKKKMIAAAVLCIAALAVGCNNGKTETTEATKTETNKTTDSEAENTETAGKRLDYKALDYVTLGEYKGLEVTIEPIKVTDEEIDGEIFSALSQNDKLEKVEEGTVKEGDMINLDYEGIMDGEAFEGGTQKGADLTIGKSNFIEGFESGLVGKKIGEDVDLDLKFPESYPNSPDLAGKPVVFHVTINHIKKAPELTDELVAEISEYKTVAKYREFIKTALTEQEKSMQDSKKLNDLVTKLIENATINEYPEELVAYSVEQGKAPYIAMATEAGQTLEEYLQKNFEKTEADLNEALEGQAKENLKLEMILKAVAETEQLTISEEELKAGAERYVKEVGAQMGVDSAEALIAQAGEDLVKLSLLQEKVLEIIKASAVVKEAPEISTEVPETTTETTTETTSETETN